MKFLTLILLFCSLSIHAQSRGGGGGGRPDILDYWGSDFKSKQLTKKIKKKIAECSNNKLNVKEFDNLPILYIYLDQIRLKEEGECCKPKILPCVFIDEFKIKLTSYFNDADIENYWLEYQMIPEVEFVKMKKFFTETVYKNP